MKILVLSNLYPPDFLGGYEIGCAQVVDALRARATTSWWLTAAPRRPVPVGRPGSRASSGWSTSGTPTAWGPRSLLLELTARAESRLVNAYNVHALTGRPRRVRARRRLRQQPGRPRRAGPDGVPAIPQGPLGLAPRRLRPAHPLQQLWISTGSSPAWRKNSRGRSRAITSWSASSCADEIESSGIALERPMSR